MHAIDTIRLRDLLYTCKPKILCQCFPVCDKRLDAVQDRIRTKVRGRLPLYPFMIKDQVVYIPFNSTALRFTCRMSVVFHVAVANDPANTVSVLGGPVRGDIVTVDFPAGELDRFDSFRYQSADAEKTVFTAVLNMFVFGCSHLLTAGIQKCKTCDKLFMCRQCHLELESHEPESEGETMCLLCGSKSLNAPEACAMCGAQLTPCILEELANTETECPICQLPLLGSETVAMLCGHKIHKECYKEQLRFGNMRCPLCRHLCFKESGSLLKWEKCTRILIAHHIAGPNTCAPHRCFECESVSLGRICTACGSSNTQRL